MTDEEIEALNQAFQAIEGLSDEKKRKIWPILVAKGYREARALVIGYDPAGVLGELLTQAGQAGAAASGAAGAAVEPAQREVIQKMVDEAVRVTGRKRPASSTTVAAQGEALLQRAGRRVQLLVVTDEAKQMAEEWLERAGEDGQNMRDAMQPTSQLLEKDSAGRDGLQTLFAKLLQTQPSLPSIMVVHDVHNVLSVCGNMKPDIIVTIGSPQLPSNTHFILDLKRQDGTYRSYTNIKQGYDYAVEVLQLVPENMRTSVVVGLTDCKKMQLLKVMRDPNGTDGFSLQLSDEMDNPLAVLCEIMLTDPLYLGGAKLPPKLSFCGQSVHLTRLLGCGATSYVYACDVRMDGKLVGCAAKVLQPPFSYELELSVLQELRGCDYGIPTVLGCLDGVHPSGFLLQPLGASLAADDADQDVPLLFTAMEPLLKLLKQVHKLGIIHRDLRQENLLLVRTDTDLRLVIIDWGFAVRMGSRPVEATQFQGATSCASNRLLMLLRDNAYVDAQPVDDLHCLVKSMYLLSHPHDAELLKRTDKRDFEGLLNLWQQLLENKPWWSEVLSKAEALDYDAVGTMLSVRFQ